MQAAQHQQQQHQYNSTLSTTPQSIQLPTIQQEERYQSSLDCLEPKCQITPNDNHYHSLFMYNTNLKPFSRTPLLKKVHTIRTDHLQHTINGSVPVHRIYVDIGTHEQGHSCSMDQEMNNAAELVEDENMMMAATPLSSSSNNEGTWNADEHDRFLKGLEQCGRNWTKIAKEYVKTRSRTQVASHAQKYFKRMEKSTATTDSNKSMMIT